MKSADKHLVDTEARLIRLLAPPFDQTDRDPGYIRAYPPGIRENGGQYTHAAAWLGAAYAKIKDGDLAHHVFDIINPITRTGSAQNADHYRREPYVLAGDVSGVGAQSGQGGWSWYTGAAGWAWQLGVSDILGIHPVPGGVRLDPCLPTIWEHAEIILESEHGRLEIKIRESDHIGDGQTRTMLDRRVVAGQTVKYPGRGRTSKVLVTLDA